MGIVERMRRWLGTADTDDGRVVEPASGSTSFHLWWQGIEGGVPIVEVSAQLEVLQEPVAQRLYFWALQATFASSYATHGAAHIGLQWNPRHAYSRAVNWGGYARVEDVQSVLNGSDSPLPSTVDDRNTRDFAWRSATPYRLRISKAAVGWRGEITDVSTDQTWLIRDLYAEGDRLVGFTVWAEVFAACTDPEVAVRWNGFEARTAEGEVRRPMSVRLTMPGGGCTNTNVVIDPQGLIQINGTNRTVRDGAVLPVPGVG